MVGIEPTTYGLRNRCSTTELHWLKSGMCHQEITMLYSKEEASSFVAGLKTFDRALAQRRLSALRAGEQFDADDG